MSAITLSAMLWKSLTLQVGTRADQSGAEKMYITCCRCRLQERDDLNLYIANLPLHISEKDIKMMFADFGDVVSVRTFHNWHKFGLNHGVAFVRMASKLQCEAIISAFNNVLLPGMK